MGIYKFGNNTYPRHIRRESNFGHNFQGKKCVLWAGKYGNSSSVFRPFYKHPKWGNSFYHCLYGLLLLRGSTKSFTVYAVYSQSQHFSFLIMVRIWYYR